MSSAVLPGPGAPATTRARRRPALRRLDPVLTTAGGVAALIVLLAVFAPLLASADPDQTDILSQGLGIGSAGHLLGTDALGRDIFSRLLYGARPSLLGPLVVAVIAVALGVGLAISSVWVGGAYDRVVSRGVDVLFAFPSLLIAVLAVAIFGQGMLAPILALSVAYSPYVARVVKSFAARERSLPYIDSCRLLGYSGLRICLRHLLPNLRGIIGAQATIVFASALVDLAAVSFLGLGAQPPTSQWGVMVQDGSSELLNGASQQSVCAGLAIVITVVAFNVLGERLNSRAARINR